MVKELIVCDCCGEEIKVKNVSNRQDYASITNHIVTSEGYLNDSYHICSHCMDSISNAYMQVYNKHVPWSYQAHF